MVIVGLGNPGQQYHKTRHNLGFMFVDMLAQSYQVSFKPLLKYQAMVAQITINNQNHWLLKPMTYMNNSGIAVGKFLKYHNLTNQDLLVIYDDMDLEVGVIRIRQTGSSGGQKGIKSIIDHLGTNEFNRIKVGIGKGENAVDHVLSKFSLADQEKINLVILKAPNIIEDLVNQGINYIMNHYNG